MSHVTTIDAKEFYDIPSLKQMCKNEGWEFIENKTTYAWFGRFVGDYPMPEGFTADELGKCSHAIKIPGCRYEVGVVKKNGKYVLMYDFWKSGGLLARLGNGAWLLKQSYNMAKAQLACKGKSWARAEVKERPGWQKMTVSMGGW